MKNDRLIKIIVDRENERADKQLASILSDFSRSAVQSLFEKDLVSINDIPIKKNAKPKLGDEITVLLPVEEDRALKPEDISLEIAYEDEDLLVINKPRGMVVHPAAGNYTGTMVNALLFHYPSSLSNVDQERPGIVHRIDKDTSGLLLVAKNNFAHERLAEQMREHSIKREYRAVVYGRIDEEGTVDAPLGRSNKDRKKMSVKLDGTGREAITHYEPLRHLYDGKRQSFTEIIARLETGRTHQIRVHMAYIKHPVAGDPVYGPKKVITSLGGQCLHAGLIGFIHPRTGEYIEVTCPLPSYFTDFTSKLSEN